MHAGGYQLVDDINKWLKKGTMCMRSTAASTLIQDLYTLDQWLHLPLVILPMRLPEEEHRVADLPWIPRELLRMADDFRTLAMPILGQGWAQQLPLIPHTKEEINTAIHKQYEQDELKAIQLLETTGSESANVITKLQLTREIVITALSALRDAHEEQVNLVSILSGARFKHHFHGVLVPTCCPNVYYGRRCNKEDNFEHLLDCYKLRERLKTGPEAVNFLVTMAQRTATKEPGKPTPMYVMG